MLLLQVLLAILMAFCVHGSFDGGAVDDEAGILILSSKK